MAEIRYNNEAKCPRSLGEIKRIVNETKKFEHKLNGEVEINVVGLKKMVFLNKKYRGKKGTTDVLSFVWPEDKIVKSEIQGEIFICYEQIIKQAKERKISLRREFAMILIHGLLHLAGYDHVAQKEEKIMFNLQEKILCCLYQE